MRRLRPLSPESEVQSDDLTTKIKALTLPDPGVADTPTPATRSLTALLVCRDKSSIKWGKRWLENVGFDVHATDDAGHALELARQRTPNVIFADAGLGGSGSAALIGRMRAADDIDAPVFALCGSSREVALALSLGTFDLARKPFDWQLLARRAKNAVERIELRRELGQARSSLASALEVADDARVRLRRRESFEPVTGLPNRPKFVDLVARGIRAADRDGNALVVFAIGLSRFRLVAEALGQRYSDAVLAEVAARLSQCLRDLSESRRLSKGLNTGAVANVGAGRFALMLTCDDSDSRILTLPAKLDEVLNTPAAIEGQVLHLSARLGASCFPRDAEDAETLVLRSEMAMRSAEERGNVFRFFSEEIDAAAGVKLKLEQRLLEAMDRGELELAYQPLNAVDGGRIVGTEALLRWPQADGFFISPEEFVPIAEESGLMPRLGKFVLEESCRQLGEWRSKGLDTLHMSVNVARSQLLRDGFPALVEETLARYDIPAAFLSLELSERGVLTGDPAITERLTELKQLGVTLSIDDFGIGESAIAYLKELPIDTIKIDRSYIKGLLAEGRDGAMTSAMIALAQKLGMSVVAEGVESEAQLSMIRSFGCDQYQGFLRSPAVGPDAIVELLRRGRPR